MKKQFTDFIGDNPNCRKFEHNGEARDIFENILSRDDVIIAMVEASDSAKPALSAAITEVEAYFNSSSAKAFDLRDNFTRQALGIMVRTVLEPFGYLPAGQKDMPRALNTHYVTSASYYRHTGPATMAVEKRVVVL